VLNRALNDNESGHGADQHHGRFALADADLQRRWPALIRATHQLLELGAVRATSVLSTIDGRRLHHLETGSGPPLVLLHGASGGAANWYRVLGQLSPSHHIRAPDLPGFGFSEALEPVAPLGTQVAELLIRWLDVQQVRRFAVAGTSFGGLVALRMAQLAPERVHSVAVIDTVGFGRSLPLALRLAFLPLLHAFALRPSRRGTRWQLEKLMTAEPGRLRNADRDALLEYLWQSASAGDQRRLARAFRLFASVAGQREVLSDAELRSFPARLLILWGERDRFLPVVHARRAAALVPRAQCRIIPRAGHSPNWEAPDEVAENLSAFLRE
jgi:pimeloyl-ACP methyl ester carboxylesterase